jgi:hypothetical protein
MRKPESLHWHGLVIDACGQEDRGGEVMTEHERRPVLRRPSVDGTEAELEEWAREFVDRVVGCDRTTDNPSRDKTLDVDLTARRRR